MNRKRQLKPDRSGAEDSLYRVAQPDASQASDDARSMPIVLATETPVPVYDVSRMERVDEILRIDGINLPNQLPLVDSHDSSSVRNVIGSIRDFERDNGTLRGRMYFASDPDAQRVYEKYRDGHLTDVSIHARRDEIEYTGGKRIVLRSTAREGSAVVAGADPNAKVMSTSRRAYIDPDGLRDETMFEELKRKLIDRGLVTEDATDADLLDAVSRATEKPAEDNSDILRWLKEQQAAATATATPPDDDREPPAKTVPDEATVRSAERERVAAIDELCRSHTVDDVTRSKWITDGTSVDDASREVLKRYSTGDRSLGLGGDATVRGGLSEREKWYEAVRSGFVRRAIGNSGVSPRGHIARAEGYERQYGDTWKDQDALLRSRQLVDELEKPAQGFHEFQYVGLPDLARMFLEQAGERVSGLPRPEICKRAMQHGDFVRRASDGAAFHTTGSFSNLMLDAANKTLLAAYDEASVTYPMWVRTAPDAADFKTLHRIRFGELPDPEAIPPNSPYPEKSPTDNDETYSVQKHGEIFSITLEAVINDDLNAITRIPQMQGNAMRRKINRSVYAVLTDNAALSDSIALFHATSHGANLDTTALAAGAPLNVGFAVMMTQSGLNSTTILNIMPRYLIVPAELSATALQITTQNIQAATVANTNLYGAGGPRPLVTVVEGQLDANSTTAWYLAADSSQVDTVELTFLQGERAPVMSREEGFTTDTIKYKIRQSFAAAAIDFRGLYQGNT